MIIGLNGSKQSGKDTVAAYLIKEYGFERRAFADPMKKSIAALFDIPFSEIDKMKNDPNIRVGVVQHSWPEAGMFQAHSDITMREFLQRYGTESHRDVFGENFWLDYTLPKDAFYAGRKIVITDMRFENEAKRIKYCGGHCVRIERPGLDTEDQHRSEQAIDPKLIDLILHNDSSLEMLNVRCDEMLDVFGMHNATIRVVGGDA